MGLPEIGSYSFGRNNCRVDIGPLIIWFSYKTPVAFYVLGNRRVVCQNLWGPR